MVCFGKIIIGLLLFACTSANSNRRLPFGILYEIEVNNTRIIIERVPVPFAASNKRLVLEGLLYYNPSLNSQCGIVITHGRYGPHPRRNPKEIFGCGKLNIYLAERGNVVLYLVRRGYGNSEGSSDSEFLATPEDSGLAAAEDLSAGVDYIKTLRIVRKNGILVMGVSQGGWAALSASNLDMPGVAATVNLAGGTNYSTMGAGFVTEKVQKDWIKACSTLGEKARLPTVWIYSENDRNHPPVYVKQMAKMFRESGGIVKLHILPPYGGNGHYFAQDPSLFVDLIFKDIEDFKR